MEVSEVEIIERDEKALSVNLKPAIIEADFSGIEEKVRELVSPYEGITEEGIMAMELSDARKARADLNAIYAELDNGRKAISRAYSEPLKAFEAEVKRIGKLISDPCKVIDDCIKTKEDAIREEHRSHLEAVYYEFLDANAVPSFAANVPFDKICKKEWWNSTSKSYKPQKYEAELTDSVADVLKEWQTFSKMKKHMFAPDEAERVFWQTLSVMGACEHDDAARKASEHIAEFHEEAPAQISDEAGEYFITVSMTEAQKDKLVAYMKQLGIKGRIRRNG